MRYDALWFGGLLLAGVVGAMLAGLVLLWATGCVDPGTTSTTTVAPTTTTLAPEPPEAGPS